MQPMRIYIDIINQFTYDRLDAFKLYMFDTGLLKYMAGVDNSAILLESAFQFKGPLVENYVLQQLKVQYNIAPRYYSDRGGEIDFILQDGQTIIPLIEKAYFKDMKYGESYMNSL